MAKAEVVSLADVLAAVNGIAGRVSAIEQGRSVVNEPRRSTSAAPGVSASKVPSDPDYGTRSGWFRSSRTGAAMYYVAGKGRNVCLIAPEYIPVLVASIQAGELDEPKRLPVKQVLSSEEFEASRKR